MSGIRLGDHKRVEPTTCGFSRRPALMVDFSIIIMGNATGGLDATLLDYYETQSYLSRAAIVRLFIKFRSLPGSGARGLPALIKSSHISIFCLLDNPSRPRCVLIVFGCW